MWPRSQVGGLILPLHFSLLNLWSCNAGIASYSVMLKSTASVNPEIFLIWFSRLVPKTEVQPTINFVCVLIPLLYPGLSVCYVTNINFLSKQDPVSFHKLVLSHILAVLPAPDRSQLHFGAICSGNMIYILCYMQHVLVSV